MVLIKTTQAIESIRGRCGGVYFKKGSHSQHMQSMPRVIGYTRSGVQGELRDRFSTMAAFWSLALLAYFAALWGTYAAINFFYKPGEKGKKIGGYQWYIYYAMQFPEEERPPFWKPPHSPGDLPDHIVTTHGNWTYRNDPTEWPDNYPSDYYWEKGTWNGKPYYQTDDNKWLLWWDTTRWALSILLGHYIWNYTYYSPGVDIWAWYTNPDTGVRAHVYIGKPPD